MRGELEVRRGTREVNWEVEGYTQCCFCDGTRWYGVPGNENDESIVCMSVLC